MALTYLTVEVSSGTRWVNLNDKERFRLGAESRDSSAKTYRKTVAESPILGGNYLIHAVPEMVSETISVWVHGKSQTDLNENLELLSDLFTQWSYKVRWTEDDHREIWDCQLADVSFSRGQVWTHSNMAQAQFTIPRYPDVIRETFA